MTAAEIKDALRRRHPAVMVGTMVGQWTTLEEFTLNPMNGGGIDLLAVSAWASSGWRRIGYEVKISRSDYRRELDRPVKRHANVAFCHEFFFAVPQGLLTVDEIAYRPSPLATGEGLGAPHLWIPPDVGLVTVGARGCYEVRRAPRRRTVRGGEEWTVDKLFALGVRHASNRPDPRHVRGGEV